VREINPAAANKVKKEGKRYINHSLLISLIGSIKGINASENNASSMNHLLANS
jgi:hypothetical protein